MASTVTAMAEGARRTASTTQETLRAGLGTASEIAQRSTDHVVELFSFSGKRTQDAAAKAAEQAVRSLTALVVLLIAVASVTALLLPGDGMDSPVFAGPSRASPH